MVVKVAGNSIRSQVSVINGVYNVLLHKIIRRVKTKNGQNTVVQTST